MPELPASFELPRLREKPHDRRLDNLRHLGRVKGVQNKICRDLKVGLVDAAVAHGSDGEGKDGLTGFLFHLARNHPKAFAGLLGKLMPLQVSGNPAGSVAVSMINVASVPTNSFFTPEALAQMSPPALLEHDPIEQPESEQLDDTAAEDHLDSGDDRPEPEQNGGAEFSQSIRRAPRKPAW
jgi:hypothetical protein